MKEIKAIIRPFMHEQVLHPLAAVQELPGMTVSQVTGWDTAPGEGAQRLARKGEARDRRIDAVAPKVAEAIATNASPPTGDSPASIKAA